MDMFSKPNIGTWVVEQIPCAFAKPNADGTSGTHYAMVLLGKNGDVIYVGSECEHKHGAGIQAMHELGGGGTCYAVSQRFSNILHRLSLAKGTSVRADISNEFTGEITSELPPTMAQLLKNVWFTSASMHNKRAAAESLEPRFHSDPKVRGLQQTVDRVTYSLLKLAPIVDIGRHADRILTPEKRELRYRSVFNVDQRICYNPSDVEGFKQNTDITVPVNVPRICLSTIDWDRSSAVTVLAVRDQDSHGESAPGKWTLSTQAVQKWANHNHTAFSAGECLELGIKRNYCIFCGDTYDRMNKHVQGAKHIDRVVEVAGLVCKATSSLGLKMLNNPKHRTAFIKD